MEAHEYLAVLDELLDIALKLHRERRLSPEVAGGDILEQDLADSVDLDLMVAADQERPFVELSGITDSDRPLLAAKTSASANDDPIS